MSGGRPVAKASQRESTAEANALRPLASLYEGTLDCVHCGLCLSDCPTYRETGRESSSPRGRIYLMRAIAEERLPLAALTEEAHLCLGCRACETACPSGVRFGSLLEQAREAVEDAGLRRGPVWRLERLALRAVVPRPRRLAALVSALAMAQRLGLDRLLLPLLPARLREMHALLPEIPPRRERRRLSALIPAEGARRGRVALFEGCIMPVLFGRENRATARVLARNGFDVVVPPDQGCCGALQAHAGQGATARRLLRANLAAFAGAGEVDAVIVNSAGCGAALLEAGAWLPGEGEPLAAACRDVCAFLDQVGLRAPTARVEGTVCYDDPCHLVHGQGVRDAPRRLLARIEGLTLVAHEDPTSCCGAAGTYNLTHPQMSRAVLSRKLDALAAADSDFVATGNPGCLMQIRAGARARGLRARVVHPVELLDLAYGSAQR